MLRNVGLAALLGCEPVLTVPPDFMAEGTEATQNSEDAETILLDSLIKKTERILQLLKRMRNSLERKNSDYISYIISLENLYHSGQAVSLYISGEEAEDDDAAFNTFMQLAGGSQNYPRLEVYGDDDIFTFFLPPCHSRYGKKTDLAAKRIVKNLLTKYEETYHKIEIMDSCTIVIENHIDITNAQAVRNAVDPENLDVKQIVDGLLHILISDDSGFIVPELSILTRQDTKNFTKMTVKRGKRNIADYCEVKIH